MANIYSNAFLDFYVAPIAIMNLLIKQIANENRKEINKNINEIEKNYKRLNLEYK